MNAETKHGEAVDVRGILERAGADAAAPEGSQAWALAQVDRVVAELAEDANRWRAVTAVYAGFQTRGDQMSAYISTPQWVGDWSGFNNAIDRHFEINGAALANVGHKS